MADKAQYYKEQSRCNWHTAPEGRKVSIEEINTGCLMRIADALEGIDKTLRNTDSGKANRVNFLERKVKRLESSKKKLKEQRDYFANKLQESNPDV